MHWVFRWEMAPSPFFLEKWWQRLSAAARRHKPGGSLGFDFGRASTNCRWCLINGNLHPILRLHIWDANPSWWSVHHGLDSRFLNDQKIRESTYFYIRFVGILEATSHYSHIRGSFWNLRFNMTKVGCWKHVPAGSSSQDIASPATENPDRNSESFWRHGGVLVVGFGVAKSWEGIHAEWNWTCKK